MSGSVERVEAESAENSLQRVRAARSHRHLLARQLFMLTAGVDQSVATEVMNALTVSSLDELPQWCLLDNSSLRELEHIAGALLFAPVLRQCIDGKQLVKWRQLLGDALFDEVLEAAVGMESGLQTLVALDVGESTLYGCGASVLLATLEGHPARMLLKERISECHGVVEHALSLVIYDKAVNVQQKLGYRTKNMADTERHLDGSGAISAGISS